MRQDILRQINEIVKKGKEKHTTHDHLIWSTCKSSRLSILNEIFLDENSKPGDHRCSMKSP